MKTLNLKVVRCQEQWLLHLASPIASHTDSQLSQMLFQMTNPTFALSLTGFVKRPSTHEIQKDHHVSSKSGLRAMLRKSSHISSTPWHPCLPFLTADWLQFHCISYLPSVCLLDLMSAGEKDTKFSQIGNFPPSLSLLGVHIQLCGAEVISLPWILSDSYPRGVFLCF